MASSRKSKRNSSVSTALAAHVAARLNAIITPGKRLVLGLSGGVDSVVLLDVLAHLEPDLRFELTALHVNHQLSPNAASWARFCRAICRERGIPCRVAKVTVARGNSIEGAARKARYAALERMRSECIALAHNADDQAETVLLQLLRGAGVRGLAAMPLVRIRRGRLRTPQSERTRVHNASTIVRPLLDVPRAEIERYARDRRLEWIEDESNDEAAYLRNWLRHEIIPRIAMRVPGYRSTLSRAANHLGEAAAVLDELAHLDAGDALQTLTISIVHLRALSFARAKNAVRLMIAAGGWDMPDAERLEEGLRQALTAKADAELHVTLGECELRRHAGVLHVLPRRHTLSKAVVCWTGEREIALPGLGGVLTMTPRRGSGISTARLSSGPVTIRAREGGERLQPDAARPRRTVKNLMQEARVPSWERDRLPFIYCGNELVCVPGLGVDHRYRACAGEAAVVPVWQLAASVETYRK
jgi:tRNA(Ile)-lysidine synthase